MTGSRPPTEQQLQVDAGLGIMLASILELLQRLVDSQEASPARLAFGGAQTQQKLPNWPVAGHDRIVVPGIPAGGTITIPAGSSTIDLLPANPGRAGLNITNVGANAVTVYGVRAGDVTAGSPTGYISPGGSWDGKISDELWCGPISVYSSTGSILVIWSI